MTGEYFRRELRGKPNFLPQAGTEATGILDIFLIQAVRIQGISE